MTRQPGLALCRIALIATMIWIVFGLGNHVQTEIADSKEFIEKLQARQ